MRRYSRHRHTGAFIGDDISHVEPNPKFHLAVGFELLLNPYRALHGIDGLPHAYFLLAIAYLARGEFVHAHDSASQGVRHYDLVRHRAQAFLYGEDTILMNLFCLRLSRWYLGYPDQAVRQADQGARFARDVSHAYSRGTALSILGFVRAFRREGAALGEHAEAGTITLR